MSHQDHHSNIDKPRRHFLRLTGASVGVIAFASLAPRLARADDLPHLTSDDATAKALGYVEDSTKVDSAKFPNHKPAQQCANCNFYQSAAGSEYAPCTLFPGKAVRGKGWCSAYVAKA